MRHLLIAIPFALIACAHKPEAKKDTGPGSLATARDHAVAPRASADASADSGHGHDDAACGSMRVHFALDSSAIDGADRPGLERSAHCLTADPARHVSIEGNTDERGTEEYNLALGDRRATTVAHYLESLGAAATQVQTVTYGKDKPLCTEHDEACWSENRRAEVNLVARPGGALPTPAAH